MEHDIYTEMIQRLTKIEVKLDNIEKIKEDVEALKGKIIELQTRDEIQSKEIKELKDRNTWLLRTTIGGLISAGIGILICFLKLGMGV